MANAEQHLKREREREEITKWHENISERLQSEKYKMQNSVSHEISILPWQENQEVHKYMSECLENFCKDSEII